MSLDCDNCDCPTRNCSFFKCFIYIFDMALNDYTLFCDYSQQLTETTITIIIHLKSIYNKTHNTIDIDHDTCNLTSNKIKSCKITFFDPANVYNFVFDQTICILHQITNEKTLLFGQKFINGMDIIMENKIFVTTIYQSVKIQLIKCDKLQPFIDSFFLKLELVVYS